ncbi:hypothetical protein [Elizabethkingia occulta]|uniref:hypothetical protein n=1 Tax=Elizabethkingia occulta TaxID=1867263 RepID=UPI00099A29AA|nr:hypothetical protein [Elizabethkingia occulta]OPB98374.1 hypothetical protein BB020_17265 [Elizabethkingia occulta]
MEKKQKTQDELNANHEKLKYVAPSLSIIHIEMEQGIATGSATVTIEDKNNPIKEDWDTGSSIDKTMDW